MQTLAGQSPSIVTRLMMTCTSVVFATFFVAPQISTTDCGTWLAVSVAWHLVVDPTGLASPSMVTRPDRGAWAMIRLLVIVTCSWYVPGHTSTDGSSEWPVSAASAAVTADWTVLYRAVAQSVLALLAEPFVATQYCGGDAAPDVAADAAAAPPSTSTAAAATAITRCIADPGTLTDLGTRGSFAT